MAVFREEDIIQGRCVSKGARLKQLVNKAEDSEAFLDPSKDKGLVYAVALIKSELEFATRDGSAQTFRKADYPDDDNWHFITTVFDRGTMRLYIDGNLMKETSAGGLFG